MSQTPSTENAPAPSRAGLIDAQTLTEGRDLLHASRSAARAARRLAHDEWLLVRRSLLNLLGLLPLLLTLALSLWATLLYAGFHLVQSLSHSTALAIAAAVLVQLALLALIIQAGSRNAARLKFPIARQALNMRRSALPAATDGTPRNAATGLAELELRAQAASTTLAQAQQEVRALRRRLNARLHHSAAWLAPAAGFLAGWLASRSGKGAGRTLRRIARAAAFVARRVAPRSPPP